MIVAHDRCRCPNCRPVIQHTNAVVIRRNGWREAYYTLRMFAAAGLTMYAFVHEHKWPGTAAACQTLYWWFKAGDEGSKP